MSFNQIIKRAAGLFLGASAIGCANLDDASGPKQFLALTPAERLASEQAQAATQGVCRIDTANGAVTLLDRGVGGQLTPRFHVAGRQENGTGGRPSFLAYGHQIKDLATGKMGTDMAQTLFIKEDQGICSLMTRISRDKTPVSTHYQIEPPTR